MSMLEYLLGVVLLTLWLQLALSVRQYQVTRRFGNQNAELLGRQHLLGERPMPMIHVPTKYPLYHPARRDALSGGHDHPTPLTGVTISHGGNE
jgi:hypothetical protein